MKLREVRGYTVPDFPSEWDFWSTYDTEFEPWTRDLIAEHVPGKRFVDIGAWIGPCSLWACEHGATEVEAWEPDPVAFGVLRAIKMLNVVPLVPNQFAVAAKCEPIDLATDTLGESVTGLQGGHSLRVWAYPYLDAVRDAGLVKIDIEGGEVPLYPLLARTPCPIILSTHGTPPPVGEFSEATKVYDYNGFDVWWLVP